MAKLLYIKASPMGKRSYSVAVADAFIDNYVQAHPGDTVKTMDVFKEPLPAFDSAAANAKYKIMHGQNHSPQDLKIWSKIVSLIEDFKSADKYVMAVPMWNFSISYRLKHYIDILVQPNYTFSVTENRDYQGLVRGKPIFIAYARGGEYAAGTDTEPFDLQKKYIELILAFIGFTYIPSVVLEPTLAGGPDVTEQKSNEAIEKAGRIAAEF
jgi:FMN-dependent NADH-azoreductase